MNNLLLDNPEILQKHQDFIKKNYEYKKAKQQKENIPSSPSYYSQVMSVYPNLKKIQKIYAYVSCLNTGKLKKINEEKLREYHIKFDEVNKRYYADKEYIKLVNSSSS